MSSDKDKLEEMLKTVAKRLGTSPQGLKDAAERGDFSNITGNGDSREAAEIKRVLSDPQAAQKLLNTPQAKALMKMLENKDKQT